MSEDRFQHAREQAQAQFESVRGLVAALETAEAYVEGDERDSGEKGEDARNAILEDALGVCVRDGWRSPGAAVQEGPEEYYILLCTGGPAVRIIGELNKYSEPETARLEMQDWFTPWTEYRPTNQEDHTFTTRIDTKAEEILLTYARQFYFGD
ncbi:MAG TPA: hypothetical protein VLH12_12315 [Usitatibacter sp.]|nr:hypothetical protein [Usitatibacter sp.]